MGTPASTSRGTAACFLRKARARAGLTQRALAQRAGITQSVVAAYESGSREPSLATLSALIDATGHSLSVALSASRSASAEMTGPIGHRLRRRRAAVLSVAEQHGVTDLQVFGSVARGEDTAESDLDLLVHLPDGAGLYALARFKEDIEALLRVPVDVVPDDGVKPRIRANIDRDLVRSEPQRPRPAFLDIVDAMTAITPHMARGPLTEGSSSTQCVRG